jgi:iron complex outermembrane receptor protein
MRLLSLAGLFCILPLMQVRTAAAQSADQGPLQEVVVTAEKRAENIQTTPISAAALSGTEIEERGITDVADLQYNTPGLSVSNNGMINIINIRGVGLALVAPNTSSGIINYRDGVLITHEPFLLDPYFDQSQIEVLRGPQGTLTGSNSTGGAILVVSHDPELDNKVSGFIEQAVGSYTDIRTLGAVNLPISDSWAARAAFYSETRDSFYTNVGAPGSTLIPSNTAAGSLDQHAGRVSLLGKPTDNLTVSLKTEFNSNRGTGTPATPTQFSPYYPYASHVPFDLSYNTPTLTNNQDWRTILTVDYQTTLGFEVRSQTGWTQGTNRETDDTDASGFDGQTTSFHIGQRTLQQELDLLSTGSGALQWTTGVFFLKDEVDNFQFYATQLATPAGPLFPYQIVPDGADKGRDEAVFGQLTYDLTPQWQLLFGARYTQNRRWSPTGDVSINLTPAGPLLPFPAPPEYDKGVTTGKFGLNFNLDSNNLIYGFAARGAKSGGFNDSGPGAPGSTFNPEIVWDYELGWKSTWLGGHVRSQLDGFFMNYSNFQLNEYNPATNGSVVGNAGHATIKGGEGQLQARVGDFGADATLAYVDSRLGSSIFYDTRYTPAIPFDVDGHELPYAPNWTADLRLQYTLHVQGELIPSVQFSYVSSQWAQVFQVANGPYDPARDYMGSRALIGATLSWRPSAPWLVEAYGKNLTNKLYVQAINSSATIDNVIYGDPRTYGIRASYQF